MKDTVSTNLHLPRLLFQELKFQAVREGKSMKQIIIEALKIRLNKSVAKEEDIKKQTYHDLDHLIGSWKEDAEIEKSLLEQRQIDKDIW